MFTVFKDHLLGDEKLEKFKSIDTAISYAKAVKKNGDYLYIKDAKGNKIWNT